MLVQVLENKSLVLGIQFRRDEIKDLLDVQFVGWIIFGDIPLVQTDNRLLFPNDILKVVGIQVVLNHGRHSTHDQIKPEQPHHAFMHYSIYRFTLIPCILDGIEHSR